jgi:hypothetical protein
MSVEVYSECRLQLRSDNGLMGNFDRCLIELRQYDIGDYALRSIDLNNNKSVRIIDQVCLPNIDSLGNFHFPSYSS